MKLVNAKLSAINRTLQLITDTDEFEQPGKKKTCAKGKKKKERFSKRERKESGKGGGGRQLKERERETDREETEDDLRGQTGRGDGEEYTQVG